MYTNFKNGVCSSSVTQLKPGCTGPFKVQSPVRSSWWPRPRTGAMDGISVSASFCTEGHCRRLYWSKPIGDLFTRFLLLAIFFACLSSALHIHDLAYSWSWHSPGSNSLRTGGRKQSGRMFSFSPTIRIQGYHMKLISSRTNQCTQEGPSPLHGPGCSCHVYIHAAQRVVVVFTQTVPSTTIHVHHRYTLLVSVKVSTGS